MPVNFAAIRGEYTSLWANLTINPSRAAEFNAVAARLHARIGMYRTVEAATGVPAALIAVIHERESNQDFSTHLHNGDPLSARTVHVPAGRPPAPAVPPFTWLQSAIDALQYQGLDKIGAGNWSIERGAFTLEGYNGFGYRNRGLRSPYLWGGTNQQQPGKYVADGQFDPSVMDTQPGAMPMLKALFGLDPSLDFTKEPTPVPAPVPPIPQPRPAPIPAPTPLPTPAPIPVTPAPSLWDRILSFFRGLFRRS